MKTENSCEFVDLLYIVVYILDEIQFSFTDVRITHPTAPSNVTLTLAQLYHRNENEKRTKYGERVRECEKASFVPRSSIYNYWGNGSRMRCIHEARCPTASTT